MKDIRPSLMHHVIAVDNAARAFAFDGASLQTTAGFIGKFFEEHGTHGAAEPDVQLVYETLRQGEDLLIVELEAKVLHALNANLMDERLVETFCQEYSKRMNELRREQNAVRSSFVKEQRKLTREKEKIVQSICDGVPAEMLKDRAVFITERLKELETLLATQPEQKVMFHPNMSVRYKQ